MILFWPFSEQSKGSKRERDWDRDWERESVYVCVCVLCTCRLLTLCVYVWIASVKIKNNTQEMAGTWRSAFETFYILLSYTNGKHLKCWYWKNKISPKNSILLTRYSNNKTEKILIYLYSFCRKLDFSLWPFLKGASLLSIPKTVLFQGKELQLHFILLLLRKRRILSSNHLKKNIEEQRNINSERKLRNIPTLTENIMVCLVTKSNLDLGFYLSSERYDFQHKRYFPTL